MAEFSGMDVQAITTVARQLGDEMARLEAMGRAVDRLVAQLRDAWRGQDAAEFARRWAGTHAPTVRKATAELTELQRTLQRNVEAQERTSATLDGAFPGAGGGPGSIPPLQVPTRPFPLPDLPGWSGDDLEQLFEKLRADLGDDALVVMLQTLQGIDATGRAARDVLKDWGLWDDFQALDTLPTRVINAVPGARPAVDFLNRQAGAGLNYVLRNLMTPHPGDKNYQRWADELSKIVTPLAAEFSFQRSTTGDFYTTNEHGFQSRAGFATQMDMEIIHKASGMDLDSKPYVFTADGKEYKFEVWKGQYMNGFGYGGEQGIYVRDDADQNPVHVAGRNADPQWAPVATGSDQLKMRQTIQTRDGQVLFTNDTRDYAENGDHFWNLAIQTQAGHPKESLVQVGEVATPNANVAAGLYDQLRADPDMENVTLRTDPATGETVVSYTWKK